MATFALQYITRDGGIAGQSIVNHDRACAILSAWTPGPGICAVAILIVVSSFQ